MNDRLGIYAPYTHNGTTAMACAIADFASAIRYQVQYVACQSRETNVHFKWDNDIRSARRTPFCEWAKQRGQIIWFDIQPDKLKQTNLLGVKNILVPLWHNIAPSQLKYLERFTTIACPHSSVYEMLPKTRNPETFKLAAWDQGLRLRERTGGCLVPGEISIYVSVNGPTVGRFGEALLPVLRLLLDVRESLRITIAHTKQWPRQLLVQARALVSRSGGRIKLLHKPSYRQRVEAIDNHDWMFCASTAVDAWWDVNEALSQGMPVICFDIPPNNEIIRPGYNGALIPCRTDRTDLGAVIAKPNAKNTLEALSRIVNNESMLMSIQNKAWPDLENRTKAFQQIWQKILD